MNCSKVLILANMFLIFLKITIEENMQATEITDCYQRVRNKVPNSDSILKKRGSWRNAISKYQEPILILTLQILGGHTWNLRGRTDIIIVEVKFEKKKKFWGRFALVCCIKVTSFRTKISGIFHHTLLFVLISLWIKQKRKMIMRDWSLIHTPSKEWICVRALL